MIWKGGLEGGGLYAYFIAIPQFNSPEGAWRQNSRKP